MANFDLAFQPENGINLDGLVGIFTGTIDPSVVGEAAPIGSLYLSTSGRLYQKVTALNTGWMVFSQGLGEALKISATDTTAGYLNTKLLTTAALTKTVGNAGVNETLTLDLATVGTAGTYKSVTTNAYGQVTAGTNPTTLAGYGITNGQPLDATLTSLSAYATVGFVAMTSADVFAGRTITGTANQITVTNGSGAAGNPTLSFPATTLTFPGTAGIILPRGTTAQRVATTAYTRFNNDTTSLEYYNGTAWVSLIASTGGTVTTINTTAPAAGLTITGGPITTSGTLIFTLANDLAALEGQAGTGFAVRTGTDTWATRTLTGTLDRIDITNGAGIAGAPTFDIASTYVGQASIVTLGNITTGSWAATTIDTDHGGTGRTSIGGANTLLGVNTTGSGLEYKVLQAGTGISISPTAQQLTVTNAGVTSLFGTTNQVSASASTGSITLSLPQNINSGATPTFAQITLAADPTSPMQAATKQYVDAAMQGIDHKASVRAATSAPITLSGEQTIDDVPLFAGDRVLVKDQTNATNNGIYIVSAGAWTRALDLDVWSESVDAFTFVEDGTLYADTGWVSSGLHTGTIGVTPMPWIQFSSAGVIQAGAGLTKTENLLSITPIGTAGTYNLVTTNAYGQVTAGSSQPYLTGNQNITLQGDVTGVGDTLITTTLSATGIAAGTYRSVTVDAKGRVSAGTNPTTLVEYNITDAQPLNAYLTALSGASADGIRVRVGNTAVARAIVAGSTKVSVIDGDGVVGNPTIDVIEANLTLNNLAGTLSIAKGGTGLSAVNGANTLLGVNAAANGLEYKALTGTGITITQSVNGINFATVNNGTVTSVAVTGGTGLTVGGSPITTSGTLTLTLGTELQALAGLSTLGLVARIGVNSYAQRSIVSGAGTLTISNPAGTAGNIGLDLATVGVAGTYKSVTTDTFGRVTAGTNPTTLAGYGITDAAPANLAFLTVGNITTLTNERSLVGTASQIVLVDGGANSTFAIGLATDPVVPGVGSLTIPSGTTAQRTPTPSPGASRFNTDLLAVEYWDGTTWQPVGRQIFVDAKYPQGFLDRTESTLAYVQATRTFTITPVGGHFTFYHTGTRIEKTTAESVVWANTSGVWYIYYNSAGVLSTSASFYDLQTQVPVVALYWDSVTAKVITFADERHGVVMDWATHQYLHITQGTKYTSGLAAGNFTLVGTGSADADAELSISNGVLFDEDLRVSIAHSTTPTNANEQVLSPIAFLPILYRIGTGSANWQSDTPTAYPVKAGVARSRYNLNTAGTWSLADAPEGSYFAMWVFGTNGYTLPVIAIMGQRTDTTLATAIDNNTFAAMDFGTMVTPESKLLYRLIYRTSSAFTNGPKAVLQSVTDMRTTTELVIATSGSVSHGLLSGLADDDHLQYVHISTSRAISAQHTFAPIASAAPFALGANAQGQLVTGFNADTVDGLHAASFQPVDADLTALAALTTTGFATRTGADTWTTRSLVAPANGLTITNPAGIAAGPIFALANDLGGLEGLATTGFAVRTATDTWSTRTLVAGAGISITNADGVAGNITIAAVAGSGVTSVALTLPSIFSVTGSPITTSGTLAATLNAQAANTHLVGPVSGGVATPTFRTVSLAQNDLSDVVITAPTTSQVLAYNSTTSKWVNTGAVGANAAGLIGVGQAGAAAWTLVSGSTYTADFAHNLGTTNVVITIFDTVSNAIINADLVTLTNTNTVRVQVIGNTRTLRVVVVANGQSIVAGGSTPSSIVTAKDGVTVSAAATKLNFTGPVTAVTDAGSGTTNVSFGSRFSYFAHSLDTPNTADFAVNAIAAATTDPTFTSLSVRSFSNTVEQGVGFTVSIPSGATSLTIKFRGRAATAPGVASVVQPRLYARQLPNNAAVGAWSAAQELANITIPTNAFFQYAQQTILLSTLGLTADRLYQVELTRRVTGVTGTNLAAAFYLAEVTCEFS